MKWFDVRVSDIQTRDLKRLYLNKGHQDSSLTNSPLLPLLLTWINFNPSMDK